MSTHMLRRKAIQNILIEC